MAEIEKTATNQSPAGPMPQLPQEQSAGEEFPDKDGAMRLSNYDYYSRLFYGQHFEAFNIKIDDEDYNRAYSKLRYVMVNFAGLVSKICADMLFSEPVTLKAEDGDQEFIEALWKENNLDVQCYESALSNSYYGDGLFKIRIGKRQKTDPKSTVIIEDITPRIYFPAIDGFNVRAEPSEQTLAWIFKQGKDDYLRKEIHSPGLIKNEVYKMKGNKIDHAVDLSMLNIAGLKPVEETRINESLIVHVPNWKTGDTFFGISDYYDLDSLFYAINNRMTKIDNILDKHSDPILMVPPGVIDEKGQVKKKALGVIEVGPDAEGGKPEYVVWDASLENAFKEIEKLIEFMYLIGEISPDVLGLGQGVSDSGRALKFKLMRTIAKVARKKLYYDRALKEVLYIAQMLAKAWGVDVGGIRLKNEPVYPEIVWADGLPIDNSEQIETETKALDAGITNKKDAIMRVYGYDDEMAEEKAKEIDDELKVKMPVVNTAGSFGNGKKEGDIDDITDKKVDDNE